ncbi:MAG TPA: response regulator transcription factor [Acidimicrobiales bacterium]|nr:response regulator transcription factor [Acidimicrobiales bacterium]
MVERRADYDSFSPHGRSAEVESPPSSRRILIVDDHALLTELLVLALNRRGFEVVIAEEVSTAGALEAARQCSPALALLDLHLGDGATSVPAIAALRAQGVRCFILTAESQDRHLLASCLTEGAEGVFYKAQPLEELIDLLEEVASGGVAIDELERQSLLEGFLPDEAGSLGAFDSLTPKEQEVLGQLIDGLTASEIAEARSVAVATVRSNIRGILEKLGVNSQLAAVALARRTGWRTSRALY